MKQTYSYTEADIKLNNPKFAKYKKDLVKEYGIEPNLREEARDSAIKSALQKEGYDGWVLERETGGGKEEYAKQKRIVEIADFKDYPDLKPTPAPEKTRVALEGKGVSLGEKSMGKTAPKKPKKTPWTIPEDLKPSIKVMKEQVLQGDVERTGGEYGHIVASTYPEWFRGKGWSAKEFNNIIDKAESGEVLTPIQDAKLKEFLEVAEDLKGKHPDLAEGPPEGDYESVSVDSLKDGETYTIIENKTKDGWDEYKIHKTKEGVTLEDGNILKLEPWDKVQVLKEKPTKIATKQPELVKEKPSLFGKPEKVGPKPKPQQPEKLTALDKVERQSSSEFKQEGIWEPKQEGLFGKTKPTLAEKSTGKPLPKESIGKAWINNQQKPIVSAREITKGKFKGKVEVTLTAGRDEMGRVKPGRKIKVSKKSVVEWPETKEPKKNLGKKSFAMAEPVEEPAEAVPSIKFTPIPKGKRRSDLIKLISKKFDVPIRTGKFRKQRGAFTVAGIYKPKAKVVRLAKANDFPTVIHEVGHHIQEAMGFKGKMPPEVK
ncbi:MAG TPA: hypothetical protein VMW25_05805, partial [Clostridia bacterium]|nr:hypothetical protein [Clostridia bacterium]